MAEGMKLAVSAGRKAYLAGRISRKMYATASSSVEGLVGRCGACGLTSGHGDQFIQLEVQSRKRHLMFDA
jgi:hypothetical protein